jgi:3-oxoacyl-[acyl-carrier protein] reductase
VGSRNITVNAVSPGFIETDMTGELGDAVVGALRERIPLGRLGSVEDVARTVRFLASEGAAYITGQIIHVNGGLD